MTDPVARVGGSDYLQCRNYERRSTDVAFFDVGAEQVAAALELQAHAANFEDFIGDVFKLMPGKNQLVCCQQQQRKHGEQVRAGTVWRFCSWNGHHSHSI